MEKALSEIIRLTERSDLEGRIRLILIKMYINAHREGQDSERMILQNVIDSFNYLQ